jgi:nitrogen fixation-related uncharacterized protein
MHPTDKKVWPIVIIGIVLLVIFVWIPNSKRYEKDKEAETRKWVQDEEVKKKQEDTERAREGWQKLPR